MAENPHARWDQVNTTLWSTKMLQGVRPSCPQCTKTHSRDRCTMHRTSSPQPFRTSTAPQAGREEVCLNFNRGCPCFFQPCRLRHSCRTCEEWGHGAYQCKKKGPPQCHTLNPSTPTVSATQQILHHWMLPGGNGFWLAIQTATSLRTSAVA